MIPDDAHLRPVRADARAVLIAADLHCRDIVHGLDYHRVGCVKGLPVLALALGIVAGAVAVVVALYYGSVAR